MILIWFIMKRYLISLWSFVVGIGLMSGILGFEIENRFPVDATIYVFVGLCTLWLAADFILLTGAVSSLFLASFFFFPFVRIADDPALTVDRIISIAIIWLAVFIALRFRKRLRDEKNKRLQVEAIVEKANEGILLIDKDGVITVANPAALKIFGLTGEDLAGRNAGDFFPDIFAIFTSNKIENEIKSLETHRADGLRCRRRNGEVFFADVRFNHFFKDGEVMILAFVFDATEQKKNETRIQQHLEDAQEVNAELEEKVEQRTSTLERINRELIKSQALYKAMAHNFPDGIIGVLNRDMKYVLVDGKGLTALGLDSSTVIGDRVFDGIHGGITAYAEGALERVFGGEHISFDLEIEGRYYNVSSVPIAPADGHVNEILVVIKNISSQKRLERELVKTLEKEKELNTLKSRFVTMASHEFRTPLTTILSSAFLLENYTGSKLEAEKKRHLERIKSAVRSLTELLNDFLSLGKLEEGVVQVSYKQLHLPSFMEDIVQEVTLLKKEDQRIVFEFDGPDDEIMMDKQLLRNILLNLLSNAIKYSPVASTIGLTVHINERHVKVKVTDQGIGIPFEEQKFIFKRFFRANNTAEIQGTGLGLNIVKRYVKLLRGKIEFTSRVNRGTSFTVTLPLQTTHEDHKNPNQNPYEL